MWLQDRIAVLSAQKQDVQKQDVQKQENRKLPFFWSENL